MQGATVLAERIKRRILGLYHAIIVPGGLFHEQQPPLVNCEGSRGKQAHRPGFNLLRRLRDFKKDVLRFVENFAVPFTNNQAEQHIRMMKVKIKISGGFRTSDGATTFASLRSVISTARKQGWNILQTLTKPPNILIAPLQVLFTASEILLPCTAPIYRKSFWVICSIFMPATRVAR